MWGPLMEKTFAKVMGNYEVLNSGSAGEAWDFTSGIPYDYLYADSNSWSTINTALSKGYIVDGDIAYADPFKLPSGHAYSILGAYTIKDANGTVTNRLIQIRNPWGYDVYNGSWNDSDTYHWTASAMS